MTLGEIIKQYREEQKMSMDAFAKKAGLSKAYISILERNYNPSSKRPPEPTLEAIAAISAAIGSDFNDVIMRLDKKQKIMLPAIPSEEQLDNELVGRLCKLNPDELEKVDAFIQGILASR